MKKYKFHILSIAFIFLLFLAYNYKLLLNISSTLTDWYDYPLMVYIIQVNVRHLMTLDFANLGNFSIYHPTPNGMYFTDLLLPQSVMAIFVYPFVKDFIVTHNIVFIVVGLLNIVSLQYFWSKIFKDRRVVTLLSLLFTFSPYTLSMQDQHYQMISYWFLFFSLGLLLKAKNSRHFLIAGVLSGLQFLAAVYIGIYSLTASGLFFIWKLCQKVKLKDFATLKIKKVWKKISKSKTLQKTAKQGAIYLIGFLLIAGYFIYQFAYTKNLYNIERPADSYINHSIQITDFLFNPMSSLWVENFYQKINTHNHRIAGETFGTGFVLLILSAYGFLQLSKGKNEKQKLNQNLMILLLAWGFIAMLGPRLAVNGNYLGFPLPYIVPLKLTPVFDALRVPSRWFFVFQIGLFYLVGIAVKSIISRYTPKNSALIIGTVLLIYAIEIVPIKQRTSQNTYKSHAYEPMINNCLATDVLVEYPFSPQNPGTHILVSLEYWTKMLLNNMHYKCQLVNGYSGFQPKHIEEYYNSFTNSIESQDFDQLLTLLNNKDVRFIKFNKEMMIAESIYRLEDLILEDNFKILINDSEYLVLEYAR